MSTATPAPAPPAPAAAAAAVPATPFTEEWIAGPGKISFYSRWYATEGAPKGLIIFAHGFIEHIARFEHVFNAWHARGFAVFAYDQRGFGRTALDTEHKSKLSVYGKFSGPEQLEDVEFFVKHAREKVPKGTPFFLYGHSMGGALLLSFCCNMESTRDEKLFEELNGVIATSPFVGQTHPAPSLKRWMGTLLSKFLPWQSFPSPVNPDDLSHDKEVSNAYAHDPLVRQYASLRGLRDMLNRGDRLRTSHYQGWPVDLPLLILHGDADNVASFKVSKAIFDKTTANDKTFTPYKAAKHELHNEPEFKAGAIEETISWAEKRLHRKPYDGEVPAPAAAASEAAPAPAAAPPAAVAEPPAATADVAPPAEAEKEPAKL